MSSDRVQLIGQPKEPLGGHRASVVIAYQRGRQLDTRGEQPRFRANYQRFEPGLCRGCFLEISTLEGAEHPIGDGSPR